MRNKREFQIVNVKRIPTAEHIVKFMKWEDDSAKSSFVIRNNREESNEEITFYCDSCSSPGYGPNAKCSDLCDRAALTTGGDEL